MKREFFQQDELADRWRVSARTLEGWRQRNKGPSYVKVGGRVVYAVADIEAYERRRRAEIAIPIVGSWRS